MAYVTLDGSVQVQVEEKTAMSEWQLIETAPKMKAILMWALTDTSTGNWSMGSGYWHEGYGGEPGVWIWEGRRLKNYDTQPTHWMPMPDPPEMGARHQARLK